MAAIDLRCDRVSKRYRVRPRRDARRPFGFVRNAVETFWPATEDFWALRDISFEVPRGETLGVIGRNGAGKSTLLKLLGGITTPTEGVITIAGRLSALIEVGSGFHPELTGRENVFLSGAILGMRRRDIAARLDSIAEFSGVSAFLETPVKYYSSGMYVRLGFAIAAHLEPDVLLVDEVLAVGDSEFQTRCLARIEELKRRGTTMLLVSHDLGAIEQLSDRAIFIDGGRIRSAGNPRDVVTAYQHAAARPGSVPSGEVPAPEGTSPDASIKIDGLTLHAADGMPVLTAAAGEPLIARVTLAVRTAVPASVVLSFYHFEEGTLLAECSGSFDPREHGGGRVVVEFVLPELLLAPGVYTLGATVTPAGVSRPIAWRFGRTTLYVQGPAQGRGVFVQPFQCRIGAGSPAVADTVSQP
jgi:ABC-type polysaccharide/polyol phosphate transport system ATPase subunit